MTGPGGERVELWRESSGFWRWRYVSETDDGSDDIRLLSNMEFTTEQAARDAAETAYPDVVIATMNGRQDNSTGRSGKPHRVVVALVIAAIAIGVVGARVRRRRAMPARSRSR